MRYRRYDEIQSGDSQISQTNRLGEATHRHARSYMDCNLLARTEAGDWR